MAGLSYPTQPLPPFDPLALGNIEAGKMPISGNPATTMIDKYQSTQNRDLISGINHNAVRRRADRGGKGRSDLDSVIHTAAADAAKARDDIS